MWITLLAACFAHRENELLRCVRLLDEIYPFPWDNDLEVKWTGRCGAPTYMRVTID